MIKYAISKDKFIKDLYEQDRINLVITCLDLIEDDYVLSSNDTIYSFNEEEKFLNKIKKELNLTKVYLSRTPYPEMIKG